MDIIAIENEVTRLKSIGELNYYIKIIDCYLDLVKEGERDNIDNIFEGCIEEYNQIIIYFWERYQESLNKVDRLTGWLNKIKNFLIKKIKIKSHLVN